MGFSVTNNLAALNAYRNLSVSQNQMQSSLEKLSSGYRINRAADDAAGLTISEHLRSQIGGLQQAQRNAQDGISVVQIADGAMGEVGNILQRMRDLSVQASNTGSQDSQATAAANSEFQSLSATIDKISSSTKFGSTKLLDGNYGKAFSNTSAGAVYDPTTTGTISGANNQVDLVLTDSAGKDVEVKATIANGVYGTASDLASAVNDALSKGLKAAGFSGNEVRLAQSVDSSGNTSFTLKSTEQFTLGDGSTAPSTVADTAITALGVGSSGATATGSGAVFQVGADNTTSNQVSVTIDAVDAQTLGVSGLDLTTNAAGAIDKVDSAIAAVSQSRSSLGATQNTFQHVVSNLSVATENVTASESRIRDTDMAAEMTQFTKAQILGQAGMAMLAQANQSAQGVMSLLRG